MYFYRRRAFADRLHEKLGYVFQKCLLPDYMFTHDIWKRMRHETFFGREFVIPELRIKGDIFHAKQVILRLLYRFNDETQARVRSCQPFLHELGPYIAVHIRRGDKVSTKEAMRIEAYEYVRTIRGLDTNISNIFLATDDYQAVQEFQAAAPAEWRVTTFCSADKNGHAQKQFNRLGGDAKKEEMIRIFIDLEFLVQAEFFIGTYSSNIGRFVALARGGHNCSSLDKKWHPK